MNYSANQVLKVLESTGVRVAGFVPDNILVFCPYHRNNRTPAGEVSEESGVFFCFACGTTASLLDLVLHVTDMSFFEAMRLVEKYRSDESIVESLDRLLVKEDKAQPFDPEVIDRLHEAAVHTERAYRYLHSRGITMDSIKKYKIGYSDVQDMVTFPFWNQDGEFIIGFQGRSIEGKEFKNSLGPEKSTTLYGIQHNKWERYAFVLESPIDSILLDQFGYPAISTMGVNTSENQRRLLTRFFNHVIIVADRDDRQQGEKAAFKTLQKIGERGIMVLPPEGYKDIGSMPQSEIQKWAEEVVNPRY